MSELEKAARQALDALEEAVYYTSAPAWSPSMTEECNAAITTLRRALGQPTCKQPLQVEQPAQQEPVAWVDAVMEQAQVFASAWSLVGGRFDFGDGLETAEQEKAALRAMLTRHGIGEKK